MRVATLLLAVLAPAPAFAAPIAPAQLEELAAHWKLHMSEQHKQELKDFEHGFVQGVKTVTPIALSLAPLIVKREEEQYLERRISQTAKDFWTGVGHGAEEAWNVLGPTAAQLIAKDYKLLGKRDEGQHLEARAELEGDRLEAREEMPFNLYERDFTPAELAERNFVKGEQHLERRMSERANNFWTTVGHGAEHVFEQLGPLHSRSRPTKLRPGSRCMWQPKTTRRST